MRAVELYIRLGLRVRATIRQLGYPTKNALKGWYQQYLKHQDLPENKAPRAQKYSLEQRQAAVAYYRAHDRCIAATMRALEPLTLLPFEALRSVYASQPYVSRPHQ